MNRLSTYVLLIAIAGFTTSLLMLHAQGQIQVPALPSMAQLPAAPLGIPIRSWSILLCATSGTLVGLLLAMGALYAVALWRIAPVGRKTGESLLRVLFLCAFLVFIVLLTLVCPSSL